MVGFLTFRYILTLQLSNVKIFGIRRNLLHPGQICRPLQNKIVGLCLHAKSVLILP